MKEPSDDLVRTMLDTVWYSGSSKHKLHPHLYDLPPFNSASDSCRLRYGLR